MSATAPDRLVAQSADMPLEPWEYRDPEQVLSDVLTLHSARDGDVLLAVVRNASAEQNVTHVAAAPPDRPEDEYDFAAWLGDLAADLPIPRRSGPDGPWHSILTVIVRRGLCVLGPSEGRWGVAWLFSNHGMDAFAGDLILVTEHGWCHGDSRLGGTAPRVVDEVVVAASRVR